jgi:sugar-specific transcriptional regulator TrmB
MATREAVTERLVQLGFSTYEARTYVGLLGTGTATGYAVANVTGVPQPKVYETLRRLKERGAVVQVSSQPARWSAVPPGALLEKLDREYTGRLDAARAGLAELAPGSATEGEPHVIWHHTQRDAIVANAKAILDAATTHVYLSGHAAVLEQVADEVAAAGARGVEFTILHFGELPFPAPRGRAVRHATTDAVLRPSARARNLAVVADSRHALWAVARDGRHWEGLHADDALLASVVKGHIRHDLFVQRMYEELPDELERHFGPGLLQLADLTAPVEATGQADSRSA